MLKRLTIENVALIDRAELEFSDGLNILTGETGAGKSVILDSIDFVLGAKADKGMVRAGEVACSVRAEFTVPETLHALLESYDIEPEETLVISRKLSADGRGSLKINGCTVTAAMLRRVTAQLVDVHGQSEHFFLLKESNQLRLLDSIAGENVASKKARLGELLSERKRILGDLAVLGGDDGARSRRMDILKYQIDEIERAALKDGEEEELRACSLRFRNAERILNGLAAARDFLLADGSGTDAVRGAARSLSSIKAYEPRCEALAERLESALDELSDIADTVESYLDDSDIDEREAERVEARLDEIKGLKKKYGNDIASVTDFLAKAKEEYGLLSDSGARFDSLTKELAALDQTLYLQCRALTEARKKAAEDFTRRVVAELKTLNIPSAKFEVEFDDYGPEDVERANSEGLGGVRFLFSANAGEPLKELGKIISGGEMSRFMLAVKAQLSSAGGIGTYIFDEIDAGIGGKTARVVAEKFVKIARDVQLIAVTHLAQVACFADREFLIEKRELNGKTHTTIRELDEEGRLSELARLIGGESEHVVAHAKELLEEADIYKKSLS